MFIYLYNNFYSPFNCEHNREAYYEFSVNRDLFNKKARYLLINMQIKTMILSKNIGILELMEKI